MLRTSARPFALAAALVMGSFGVAGCSAPGETKREPSKAPPITSEPAPVAESIAKYDALTAELVAAEEKMPGITWAVDDTADMSPAQDGRCMQSSADIVEPSRNFEDLFAAADPVLEKHGFPAFDGIDPVPGGWVVTRSTDAVGATVSIRSKFPAYLRITVPVDSGSCDNNATPEGDRWVLANLWGPSGGTLDGEDRAGTLELTEDEYKENFDSVYSVDVK